MYVASSFIIDTMCYVLHNNLKVDSPCHKCCRTYYM